MDLPGLFLVISVCIFGLNNVEATQHLLNLCFNELQVIYPELDIDKCLTIPQNMRKRISYVWGAPKVYFPAADENNEVLGCLHLRSGWAVINDHKDLLTYKFDDLKLAEPGLIAQAALREQRLDISLILIPSRVHSKKSLYVLVMVDPDAPSNTRGTYWRHWVIADIKGSALQKGGEVKGSTLTGYHPPTPPRGSGLHRYQFMLYQQPAGRVMSLPGPENPPRSNWNLNSFIETNELGPPDATVQFRTQNHED